MLKSKQINKSKSTLCRWQFVVLRKELQCSHHTLHGMLYMGASIIGSFNPMALARSVITRNTVRKLYFSIHTTPQATPVTHSTARSHPGGFSHTVTISGTAVGTDQLQVLGYFLDISTLIHYPHPFIQFLQAVLCLPDISVSVDASAITINCSKSQLSKVLQKTKTISKVKPFYKSL